MRVFVVGTGRCGSVTFCKACEYIENFTVAHETVFNRRDKLDWPDQYIAVEPSLWPLVPLLRKRYPRLVLVHLVRRNRAEFIHSYRVLDSPPFIGAKNYRIPEKDRLPEKANWEGAPPVIDVWAACYVGTPIGEAERRELLGLYYDTVNTMVRELRPDVTVTLEEPATGWRQLWRRIEALGDYEKSLAEWDVKHNSRGSRNR